MLREISESIAAGAFSQWLQGIYWLWPVLEIIHFIGLSLLFGGLIIVDLRMAGFLRTVDPAATHSLLPVVILGFALNLVTGLLFFWSDPVRYTLNIGFRIKMALILIAGLNAGLSARLNSHLNSHLGTAPAGGMSPGAAAPAAARITALTSLGLWTGVLLLGRLIPYVGTG